VQISQLIVTIHYYYYYYYYYNTHHTTLSLKHRHRHALATRPHALTRHHLSHKTMMRGVLAVAEWPLSATPIEGIIAVASWPPVLSLRYAATAQELWEAKQPPPFKPVWMPMCHSMSGDGKLVIRAGSGKVMWNMYKVATGTLVMQAPTHDGDGVVCGCKVLRSGVCLSAESAKCRLDTWPHGTCCVAFSQCARLFVTGAYNYEKSASPVVVWDTATGERRCVFERHEGTVHTVCFSPDATRVASTSEGCILVWDVQTGGLLWDIAVWENGAYYKDLQFSPTHASTLASVCQDTSTVTLWNTDTRAKISDFGGCHYCRFSPDGSTIATGGSNASAVVLVDAVTTETKMHLRGDQHWDRFTEVAWSPDGSKLVTGGDSACKIWDPATGVVLLTFKPQGMFTGVSWRRDWVREEERAAAFSMCLHKRLGNDTAASLLNDDLLRMIFGANERL
jgi:hypothetical protein